MNGSVSAVVLGEDGEGVLLHLREDFRVWSLPGGRVEAGEGWEEAAVRETEEETGFRIRVERLVGRYTRPNMPGGPDTKHVCLGRVVDGAPIRRGPETLEVAWFPLDALPPSLPRMMREYVRDATTPDGPHAIERTQRLPRWYALALGALLRLRDLRDRRKSRV